MKTHYKHEQRHYDPGHRFFHVVDHLPSAGRKKSRIDRYSILIGFSDLVIRIAEERESQAVLIGEFFLLRHLVRADAENGDTGFCYLGQCVPHCLGLGRSAGCIGLRVKEEKEFAASEIGQGYNGVVLVRG